MFKELLLEARGCKNCHKYKVGDYFKDNNDWEWELYKIDSKEVNGKVRPRYNFRKLSEPKTTIEVMEFLMDQFMTKIPKRSQ